MQRMRDASIELAKGKYLFLLHHSFATGAFSQLSFDQSMGLRMAPDLSIHSENIKLDLIRPSQLQFYTNTFYSWMHFVEYCYCHFYSLVVMAMGSISNAILHILLAKAFDDFSENVNLWMWISVHFKCAPSPHRIAMAPFYTVHPFFPFYTEHLRKTYYQYPNFAQPCHLKMDCVYFFEMTDKIVVYNCQICILLKQKLR